MIEILLLVGVIAAVLFVAVMLIEGAVRPGYDPAYHTGSELELGERGWIQRVNFFVCFVRKAKTRSYVGRRRRVPYTGATVSRWYRFLYGIGFTPWESDAESLAPQLGRLVAVEEARRGQPYGRALDLGCGTGRWSVELARRGWDAVGVDVVPKAVRAARRRAEKAEVDVAFFEGDVTALREAGVGSGFSFLLDVECFNHLSDDQRRAMGREIDAVASPEAGLLLLVWKRGRRGPLPPGADPEDLAAAFPKWRIVEEQPYDGELPGPLKSVAPRWYRLERP